MIKADFHIHTDYCDGKNSLGSMIEKAYEMGITDFGISEHIYIKKDNLEFGITGDKFLEYKEEINKFKEIYEGKMNIYFGAEIDALGSDIDADYKIGSCHCINKNNNYVIIDYTEEILCNNVKKYWNGNWYEFAKDYYECLSCSYTNRNCDIIGHFDVITKFNEGYKYFDEEKDEYLECAYNSMKKLNSLEIPFEINTGAMANFLKSTPYPNKVLLKELYNMGGRIIINSDSHNVNNICYKFDEAIRIAKECGFKTSWILDNDKRFKEIYI